MNIFTIGDLHLSFGTDKPMDKFGGWQHYVSRLEKNWRESIAESDLVVIPGDISWAMDEKELLPDLQFLQSLPGRKLLMKGNHDYWWSTVKKLTALVNGNGLESIGFLHNDALVSKDRTLSLCGTRGWKCPGDSEFKKEDRAVYEREIMRLELSLKSSEKESEIWVFMHYPPMNGRKEMTGFLELFGKYRVAKCFYGHLHGRKLQDAHEGVLSGIPLETVFCQVSCDKLNFNPLFIKNNCEFN